MENLIITPTNKTPSVDFNFETGVLTISGRSIPENSLDFYKPLFNFADEYSNSPAENTEISFTLDYFNTSSSKCILELIKKFEPVSLNGNNIVINWHYDNEDEDMFDAGNDFAEIIKIPFNMVENIDLD